MANLDDILRRRYGNPPRGGNPDVYDEFRLLNGEPLPPEEELRAWSEEVDLEMRREEMVVSPMQLQLELHRRKLLDACEALVAGADREVQIRWLRMVAVHRLNPFIIQFGEVVGLTPLQIDEIFEAAALIEG